MSRQRVLQVILLAVILLVLAWPPLRDHLTRPAATSPRPAATSSAPLPQPTPPADARMATVTHVHDGDTLRLRHDDATDDVRVRLLRIDAPELPRDEHAAECGAEQATAALRRIVPEGTTVLVATDVEPTDQYGRELVHMWTVDGVWVNGWLLAQGHARVVTFRPNTAWTAQVETLQARARAAGKGIWSTC